MKIDATAAAYGLIQVVYADVTERLAYAVFSLQQKNKPQVSFEKILQLRFTEILKRFRSEAKQHMPEDDLCSNMCNQLIEMKDWRNERIHARVRQTEEGFALYNRRTGQRLSMDEVECEQVIQRLSNIVAVLEECLPRLLRCIDLDLKLECILGEQINSADSG